MPQDGTPSLFPQKVGTPKPTDAPPTGDVMRSHQDVELDEKIAEAKGNCPMMVVIFSYPDGADGKPVLNCYRQTRVFPRGDFNEALKLLGEQLQAEADFQIKQAIEGAQEAE